jgi:hypothetical protein
VAPQAGGKPWILKQHQVTSVTPYRIDKRVGRGGARQLRGAEVGVQAEPEPTVKWLSLTLGRHPVEMRGSALMPDCTLDVDAVRVEVASAGPGLSLKLIAKNAGNAAEVLPRAELLPR